MKNFKERAAKAIFGTTADGCCYNCKQPFKIDIGNDDGTPGRVYSQNGLNEISISRLCETCFDKICD